MKQTLTSTCVCSISSLLDCIWAEWWAPPPTARLRRQQRRNRPDTLNIPAATTAATMHIPTAALSALSATCLFVGSHAQASADCQALTAKFIVQVARQAAAAPSASARCRPRARSDDPRARWPYHNWRHSLPRQLCSSLVHLTAATPPLPPAADAAPCLAAPSRATRSWPPWRTTSPRTSRPSASPSPPRCWRRTRSTRR